MATNSGRNSNPKEGTELKFNLHMPQISGYSMSDFNWSVEFYVETSRIVTKTKDECNRVDDDNYTVVIDTAQTGSGVLKGNFIADIPDKDCEDGLRKEIRAISFKKVIDKRY